MAKKVRGNFAAYDWIVEALHEEPIDQAYAPHIALHSARSFWKLLRSG